METFLFLEEQLKLVQSSGPDEATAQQGLASAAAAAAGAAASPEIWVQLLRLNVDAFLAANDKSSVYHEHCDITRRTRPGNRSSRPSQCTPLPPRVAVTPSAAWAWHRGALPSCVRRCGAAAAP